MHLNRNQSSRNFLNKLSEWLMLPAMVEVTHFYGTVNFCNCRYMGWYRVSHNVNVVPKKITEKYSIK